MPGINSAGVSIVPIEADGVASDCMYFVGTRGRLKDGKRCFRLRFRLARLASIGFAFFHAFRARAGRPQPGKSPMARVAVLPDDFYASAVALVDANVLRIDGFARQLLLLPSRFAGYIFRDNTDALMAHTLVLHLNLTRWIGARPPPLKTKRLQAESHGGTRYNRRHERRVLLFYCLIRNRMQKHK